MESAGNAAPVLRSDRDIYSVSRLNREVKVLLERGFGLLWLEAEVSNLARPSSGHWYFSLKDSGAQVRCCMFRQRNMLAVFSPKDGQKVLVRARIGMYEPRGEYQLIIEHMEDAGVGALKRQFEELAARLSAEGLFAAERKRTLPVLPKRIGVVTSPSGAAVRDILHVLARRFAAVPVVIYPTQVQGATAHLDIIAAIEIAGRRAECDVLILARGGGSLEDLWAFNNEALARAIVASPIPIVSGVGHEVDFTIADYAADLRAPTPSAAAEIVVPDGEEWSASLGRTALRLRRVMLRILEKRTERLRWLIGRAERVSPLAKLTQQAQRLDELEQRLTRSAQTLLAERRAALGEWRTRLWQASPIAHVQTTAAKHAALNARLRTAAAVIVRRARERLAPLVRTLNAVSPLATLERGYAIVSRVDGGIVRTAADAPPGTEIEARLGKGRIRAKVESSA
jgi:exodeoxyribonuclease VII large subunit